MYASEQNNLSFKNKSPLALHFFQLKDFDDF